MRRHHAVAPWSDLVEVYWADGCEAYVTPVSEGEVGVALLWSGFQTDFEGLLGRFPRLRRRLEGSRTVSRTRGAAVLEQRTRAVHSGPVALVGDAAGYRDAITGEGLSLAFHQAVALAAAIDAGDLGHYERAQRRLTRLPYALIRVLLELEARPRLRRRLVATLAAEPDVFARLLAIHSQQATLRSLGGRDLWRLLRGLCH
jgi:flavin-dependent dehydrogenase